MTDLIAGISFAGVADGIYDVALLIAGVLIVRKGVMYILGMIK